MDCRTILAYSYKVTGNEKVISEIERMMPDKRRYINWYNFNSGDFYWDDNGNRYLVSVDHNARTVILKEWWGEAMVRKTSDGKYIPVVYDKGFVDMVELKDGKWKVVECDTLEEAEQKEKEYKEFWKDSNR